ncbi:MAG: type VI secretion system baseplate subunit TssK [Bryobacteraceae bacterium]
MKRLQPVVWQKGALLTPQHLQGQDRFIESLLQFHVEALNFRPWGFAGFEIDQEALATGLLSLTRASGLFPDGLIFDIPTCDPAPAAKPLAPYMEGRTGPLTAFLAVPHYREHGWNLSAEGQSADTRWIAGVETLRDETSQQSEKPIQIARKNLRLLVEGETGRGTSTLPLARISRSEAGVYQLDPSFVPPLLDISASGYLTSIARRLVEIVSARSSELAGMRRQKNQSLAEFTSADIANFWLLYTINTHLPLLRHIYESKHGHPEGLYSLMLSLAGALTTFSIEIHPRDLPVYDHDELSSCFTELDQKLRFLLETVVPSNYVALPLKLVRPSIYAASLDEDKYLLNTKMYLAVSAEMGEADLIVRAPQLIKVCSANHIEHLVQHALPGLQLTHVAAPPGSIPVKLNYQYFSLNQSGLAWEAITRARNVAAYVPGDIQNPQLELIILLPQAG